MLEDRDTAYGRVPLPAGIRSRMAANGNGLDMHFLEAGFEEPGRPCALLLHGFPELAYSWRRVMPALAEAGFHVVAPDQRGYGRTTGWDADYDADLAPYRLFNLVRDVMGLLDAIGHRDVALLAGHDYGASVAAWAALIRPDIFRRLVLMSAPFPGPPDISPQPPPARSIHDDLAALDRPRKHYHWYYSTRPANADMRDCPQGVHDFLRAYFHHKSADWAGNRPFRLAGWTAGGTCPDADLLHHGPRSDDGGGGGRGNAGRGGNRRLPLASRCGACGLCAGIRASRVPGRAELVPLPDERGCSTASTSSSPGAVSRFPPASFQARPTGAFTRTPARSRRWRNARPAGPAPG